MWTNTILFLTSFLSFLPDQRENDLVFFNCSIFQASFQLSVVLPCALPHFASSIVFLKWTSLSWMVPWGLLNSIQKSPWHSRLSTESLEDAIFINVPTRYTSYALHFNYKGLFTQGCLTWLCSPHATQKQLNDRTELHPVPLSRSSSLELWLLCTKPM